MTMSGDLVHDLDERHVVEWMVSVNGKPPLSFGAGQKSEELARDWASDRRAAHDDARVMLFRRTVHLGPVEVVT